MFQTRLAVIRASITRAPMIEKENQQTETIANPLLTPVEKDLDQFYTKDEVALECVDFLFNALKDIDIDTAKLKFLEPSAGGGAFIRALNAKNVLIDNNIYAFDLDPHQPYILKNDFLNNNISNLLPDKSNLVTIGNPPFGKRAKLAAQFVNISFYYSDVVAFILPLQFQKHSAQNMINGHAKLVFVQKLKPNSFLFKDKDYDVRCCFQIWTVKKTSLKDVRLRGKPITQHKDFEMFQYNNTEEAKKYFDKEKYKWDFAVPRQGYKDYTIKETDPNKMDPRTQWIFFKAKNQTILSRLMNIDFDKLSKKNTSTPGFGKADVIEEYVNLYED